MIPPIILAKGYFREFTVYWSERGWYHIFHTALQKKEKKFRSIARRATYLTTSIRAMGKEETTMDKDTAVKNELGEKYHYSCADHEGDTLTILKRSEIGEGDVCLECKNELEWIDPDEEDDD